MLTCSSKQMNSLQRRTLSLIGVMTGLSASISLELQSIRPNHFSTITYLLAALAGAAPIVASMVVLGRYLLRETDEYIRGTVIQSLLWGFGLVIVADTVLGYMMAFNAVDSLHLRILGVFNMEVFLITAGIALRIKLWRDR